MSIAARWRSRARGWGEQPVVPTLDRGVCLRNDLGSMARVNAEISGVTNEVSTSEPCLEPCRVRFQKTVRMSGAHVRGRDSRSPPGGDRGDSSWVLPADDTEPPDTGAPVVVAADVDASRLTVSEEEATVPVTPKRVLLMSVLIVMTLVGVYFLIPKLAGLKETWGQLRSGDPRLLAVGGVLELLSIAGYATLFRTVFGRGVPRIDWRVSLEIPLAGIAAVRLVAAAGAGGVAVTAWALRRAGMSAEVIAGRMVARLVIQYSIYLGAVIVCGLGLWTGMFGGGGSVAITLFPAVLAAVLVAAVLSMALLPRTSSSAFGVSRIARARSVGWRGGSRRRRTRSAAESGSLATWFGRGAWGCWGQWLIGPSTSLCSACASMRLGRSCRCLSW